MIWMWLVVLRIPPSSALSWWNLEVGQWVLNHAEIHPYFLNYTFEIRAVCVSHRPRSQSFFAQGNNNNCPEQLKGENTFAPFSPAKRSQFRPACHPYT